MPAPTWDVIVVGGGVLGTFHAYHAAKLGLRTLLVNRARWPDQASVRNFGMVVPSSLPPGPWRERACESARIYNELSIVAGIEARQIGTLYLATTPAELTVIEQFAAQAEQHGYVCNLLDVHQSRKLNTCVRTDGCLGGLHFPDDLRLDPRSLFQRLIPWMCEKMSLVYRAPCLVNNIHVDDDLCVVSSSDGQQETSRFVVVCPGAELQLLFPTLFDQQPVRYCKLQMMRTVPQSRRAMTTNIASGLTLRRYQAFSICDGWASLCDEPVEAELQRRGIHILLVQDTNGSVIVGDSHEYSNTPLDDSTDGQTDRLILREAQKLIELDNWSIERRWHGVYTSLQDDNCLSTTVHGRIHVVTGISGRGMTVSPAFAREQIEQLVG